MADFTLNYTGAQLDEALMLIHEVGVATLKEGEGAPTSSTLGIKGMFYTDTLTGKQYKCTAKTSDGQGGYTYTWLPLADANDLINKAEKQPLATEGNFAAFNGSGNPVDSGTKASDFASSDHTHPVAMETVVVDTETDTIEIPLDNVDVDQLTVYQNGILLSKNINYTCTPTTITLIDYLASPGDAFTFIGAIIAPMGANSSLPLSGGTMSGFITLHADPTSNMHAATKQYVDNAIAAAISAALTELLEREY